MMNHKMLFDEMVADFLAIGDLAFYAQHHYGFDEFEVAELTRIGIAHKCAVVETGNYFK